MAQVVEADELRGPVGVVVSGAVGVTADAASPADAVEQAWGFGAGQLQGCQAEHVMVEEGEGGVGLFEGGEGVTFFGACDVLEELADFAGLEVTGMAFIVEEDEAAGPVGDEVGWTLLAEVIAGEGADEVEQAWRSWRSVSGWSSGEHCGTPMRGKNGDGGRSVPPNRQPGKGQIGKSGKSGNRETRHGIFA
jgi:hypothetical protein